MIQIGSIELKEKIRISDPSAAKIGLNVIQSEMKVLSGVYTVNILFEDNKIKKLFIINEYVKPDTTWIHPDISVTTWTERIGLFIESKFPENGYPENLMRPGMTYHVFKNGVCVKCENGRYNPDYKLKDGAICGFRITLVKDEI